MFRLILVGLFLFAIRPAYAADYPLLDGQCGEYDALEADVHEVDERIRLNVFQDEDYVWICYTIPEQSYGTLDLRITAPGIAEPLNLHVSAQLGEWRADHPGDAPPNADSDRWWKVDGWYSNALRMNGMRDNGKGRRLHFMWSPARELQIAKSRFGRGEWRLVFDIGGLASADGTTATRYPSEGELSVSVQ